MQPPPVARRLAAHVWRFEDSCNVYVLQCGDRAFSVDFGSGAWLKALPALGIRRLTDVFLTHHHADQCAGLLRRPSWPFTIHAPGGEAEFLDPARIRQQQARQAEGGCHLFPRSYAPPPRGIPGIAYDLGGNTEHRLQGLCLRFLLTPGHSPHAVTLIVELDGLQWAFCGDAVHAGATIWQPYHLEWDHWTGAGALAAWEGVRRLRGPGLDRLCPSHGPILDKAIPATLQRLDRRLLDFYRAKGSICAGEKDHIVVPTPVAERVFQISPHLFMGFQNGYLLRSDSGACLLVDPTEWDADAFEAYFKTTPQGFRPEVALVSHAHFDHYAGIPRLRRDYGLEACLHPRVARAILSPRHRRGLYRGLEPLPCDRKLPETGPWRWREYVFQVAPWPGQTWWHAAHQVRVDGQTVFFGGDSFQPASRWNGTGGFCAANLSRFREGFEPSLRMILDWKPDLLANGHRNLYRFTASRFRRILRWTDFAERATRALCPTDNLEKDYYFLKP